MALNKYIQDGARTMRVATYHKVEACRMRYGADQSVPGSVGVADILIYSYEDEAARQAGEPEMFKRTVSVRFGKGCAKTINLKADVEVAIQVVLADEPTRSDLYAALAEHPDFSGSVAV